VWALSHTHAADQGLRNWFFAERGLTYWSTYTAERTGTSSPLPSPDWHWSGDDFEVVNGRRRGSQPAVPRSRVRTAQARFCGSRGGQPPRLPDR
jgi:hypothetical protein